MNDNQGMVGMALGSWLVAAAVGGLAAVMLWVLGDWSFMQGAFAGIVIALIVGGIVSWLMTRPLPAPGSVSVEPKTPGETPAKVKAAPPTVEANKDRIKPSAPLQGQAELATRKPAWTYQPAAPTVQDAIDKSAGKAPKKKAAAPAAKKAAPASGPDDLKLISGVGPALENKLNDAGITRFEQIANMSAEDVERIEEQLSFKGRMERDDWIGQAKILAAGGETEFSKKNS